MFGLLWIYKNGVNHCYLTVYYSLSMLFLIDFYIKFATAKIRNLFQMKKTLFNGLFYIQLGRWYTGVL